MPGYKVKTLKMVLGYLEYIVSEPRNNVFCLGTKCEHSQPKRGFPKTFQEMHLFSAFWAR